VAAFVVIVGVVTGDGIAESHVPRLLPAAAAIVCGGNRTMTDCHDDF
jgi:hypothetical protein